MRQPDKVLASLRSFVIFVFLFSIMQLPPSQFRIIRDALESLMRRFASLTETVDKRGSETVTGINNQTEVQNKAGEEIQRQISSLAIPQAEREASESNQERRQAENRRLQRFVIWVNAATAVFTLLAFIAAAHYASIAGDQLKEMRRTNCLTQKALANSDTALKQTLEKMQGQIDATNDYSVVAAGAYLTSYGAHIDTNSKSFYVNVLNIGHLSADGEMTIFEMTVDRGEQTKFTVGFPIGKKLDGYWTRSTFLGATYATPPIIRNPLPNFSQDDYVQGKIAVIVSGELTYRDGFPKTPAHTVPFCWISFENLQTHQQDGIPCEEQRMTARIKRAIGFPNSKMPEP